MNIDKEIKCISKATTTVRLMHAHEKQTYRSASKRVTAVADLQADLQADNLLSSINMKSSSMSICLCMNLIIHQ